MIYENIYKDRLYTVREIDTLKEMLTSCKELFGKKPAFLYKEEKGGDYKEINFITLKDDVDALGTKLIDMGLEGENIAVIGENCYAWMVSYFAIVNGVGKVVPLDKELSKGEIINLLTTAECKAVFYTSSYKNIFRDIDIPHKFQMEVYSKKVQPEQENTWDHLLEEGRKMLGKGDRRFTDMALDPMEVRMLLFTSGTTDVPKAVMLCHKNIVSNVQDISRFVRLKEDDRALSILPIHHTFESSIGIMVVLFQGCSVAFYEGLKYVVKNLAEAQATLLVGVPLIFESMYSKIWKQAEKSDMTKALKMAIKLHKTLKKFGIDARKKIFKSVYSNFGGKLRMLVTGAAAINPNVVRGFQDLGIDIVMGYGLTEASPLVSGTPDFSDRYGKAGSSGQVVPSGQLQIMDQNEDGIGEILFKGPNVMLGYYNMPEKTAEVIQDGWFHTGDLGFVDENGWLYLTGRKKNVIVTKTGKNIYPEEIEEYLSKIPYIEECMVYGTDNEETGETTVSVQIRPAYETIKGEFGYADDPEQVYKLLKDKIADINLQLPNYKRVRHIVIRSTEFIKTTTQKIKRQENMIQ
ncbi:AMP-dependent synthetase/ligase [Aminipila luticellarii]|uniref:Long-chain fatty acid--CoA ligase n=1 Tax=Aminipila luticellarii TaxID=2507160 RepID=A0A410PVJ0_9FIRM|nr:AMP-binding protein [Aminipila luticellarii]QAT42961.1 long-chain fatty acid--CoA ligase [Aminipila luticellarii]